MLNMLCASSPQRETWAVALSFASATIMALEALHPGACIYFDMSADQYFGISALFASLSTFLGTFIFMRALARISPAKA